MFDGELYNKEEISNFLDQVILQANNLIIHRTESFDTKLKLLSRLKKIVISRTFPVLRKEDGWCYMVQCTYAGLYLNMVVTEEYALRLPNGRFDAPGFQMISIKSKHITLDKFAKMNEISEATVRQQLKLGYYPYARKTGSSWTLPESSRPMKEELLIGKFYVFEDSESFIAENGTIITLSKDDQIKIIPMPRDEKNRKWFTVEIESFDLESRVATNYRTFELGAKDKNNFIFHLVRSNDIQYWSDHIGLFNWLLI